MITIDANGIIFIDGAHTGSVAQTSDGTIVRDRTGKHVTMPRIRYALSCDRPASGVPGRADFEGDLWNALWSYA